MLLQLRPSQCWTVCVGVSSFQMSCGPVAAIRPPVTGTACHEKPFQCALYGCPNAHTSVAENARVSPKDTFWKPVGTIDHCKPSQCSMSGEFPSLPTAQTSVLETTDTPYNAALNMVDGEATVCHVLPSQLS